MTPPDAPRFPLSFAQQRLWFVQQLDGAGDAYVLLLGRRLRGMLDPEALAWSLREVVRRHDALRTSIALDEGEPVQVVAPDADVALRVVDVRGAADPDAAARAQVAGDLVRGLDPAAPPLLRAALVRLANDEHWLVLVLAHLIADGASAALVWRELAALYAARTAGAAPALPLPRLRYGDWARAQRAAQGGEAMAGHERYWRRVLAGVPPLALPVDRPRPAVPAFRGARSTFVLAPALRDGLRALGAAEGASFFLTLLATFQVLLARLSGQDDIVVGVPLAQRDRPELETLVGLLASTVAVRTDLSGEPSFRTCVRRARDAAVGALEHAAMPFERVVAALGAARDRARHPLFQVLCNDLGREAAVPALGDVEATELELENGTAKLDLTLAVQDAAAGLRVLVEYDTELFDATTIARLGEQLRRLVEGALGAPDRPFRQIPILTAAEVEIALAEPAPARAAAAEGLHALVERQAARTPKAVAVASGALSLRYDELIERARRLARALQDRGVGPEHVVGLAVDRSPLLPIGMLGILQAGAACLPLDPFAPPTRLAALLRDAGATVVVTERALAGALAGAGCATLALDGAEAAAGEAPPRPALPAQLAFVIYTSGSTGAPKGVQLEHRAVAHVLCELRALWKIEPRDVVIGVAPAPFDLAVLDVFLPLLAGARLVLATRAETADGRLLAALIETRGGTFMNATPATWRLLADAGWAGAPALRAVSGGEPLPPALAALLAQGCRELWNAYAPCETTIYSTAHRGTADGAAAVGRALPGLFVRVLGPAGEPVPLGTVGEVRIGGAGVSRGYRGRPDLTAARFTPDASARGPGRRLFRTGDRGRWLPSGALALCGRADAQIKVRGVRIEPAEVEAALARHPAVAEGAVVAQPGPGGEPELVAHVVLRRGGAADVQELRGHLRARLPDAMVPARWSLREALPRTASGKVDRPALMREPLPPGAAAPYVAPRTAMERTLAAIWRDALGAERIGVHDDFFASGGHSLLAARVAYRIARATGVEVQPVELFLDTLAQLARRCERRNGAAAAPGRAAAPAGEAVEPFFFGPARRRLYGVWHAPANASDGAAGAAVLLCPPFGPEYVAAHPSLGALARRLAQRGIGALRFDLSGCGDAAGEIDAAALALWLEDVALAAAELRARSGASRLCVGGLRLGATLAALAAARGALTAAAAVLWEPVVAGRAWIDELRERHEDWLRATFPRRGARRRASGADEVLGFRLPPALRDELAALALAELPRAPAPRVLLAHAGDGADFAEVERALLGRGAATVRVALPGGRPWLGAHGATVVAPDAAALERLVAAIAEVAG